MIPTMVAYRQLFSINLIFPLGLMVLSLCLFLSLMTKVIQEQIPSRLLVNQLIGQKLTMQTLIRLNKLIFTSNSQLVMINYQWVTHNVVASTLMGRELVEHLTESQKCTKCTLAPTQFKKQILKNGFTQ